MSGIQEVNWFNQNMYGTPYQYGALNAPPGMGTSSILKGMFQGASNSVNQYNKANNWLKSGAIGTAGMKNLDIGSKFGSAIKGGWKGAGGVGGLGTVAGKIDTLMPSTADNKLTAGLDTAYDTTANALMAIPGWGTIAGGIMKLGGLASEGLNKLTNGATTVKNSLYGGDKVMNSKFLSLTPLGLANSLTKKSIAGSDTDLASTITTGYQATDSVADTEIGGVTNTFKKMFGKDKTDPVKSRTSLVNQVNKENALKSQAGYIANKQTIASNNAIADVDSKNRQKLLGGQNTRAIAAKSGAKLLDLKNIKAKANRNIKLKQGGIIPQNLIPSGQFHSRNHGIEVKGDISKKGIPVISMEDGGEIKQHAEIEVNEIIFHKQLTESVEKLYKEYENGNNEAALEAGKLLVYEILENTQDNTGIIKTI